MDCHLIISCAHGLKLLQPENWDFPLPGKLLVRAQYKSRPIESLEAWLCHQFGAFRQEDWPIAPLALLGEGGAPGEYYWLRADPAHVQLKGNALILAGGDNLRLSPDEATHYIESLNQYFREQGLSFQATRPQHWYVKLEKPQRIQTLPFSQAVGRDIHHHLPSGQDALKWHGVLNEVQMLLSTLPINDEREQAGQYPVNSIWLWGGGVLPKRFPAHYDCIWSDDELTKGLAWASSATWSALPACWAGQPIDEAGKNRLGIVLDASQLSSRPGDAAQQQNAWIHLEQNWLLPMQHSLERKTLHEVAVYMVNDAYCHEFRVKANDLWKFWRRNKTFKVQ
jgi:hypothetical protein